MDVPKDMRVFGVWEAQPSIGSFRAPWELMESWESLEVAKAEFANRWRQGLFGGDEAVYCASLGLFQLGGPVERCFSPAVEDKAVVTLYAAVQPNDHEELFNVDLEYPWAEISMGENGEVRFTELG